MFTFHQMDGVDVEVLRDDTYQVDVLGDNEKQITYMTPFEGARTSGQRMHGKAFQEDKYPEEATDFYRKRSYLSDDLSVYKDDNFYHRPFPGEIYEKPHNALLENFEAGTFFIGTAVGIVVAIIIVVFIFLFIRLGYLNKVSHKITDAATGEARWRKEQEKKEAEAAQAIKEAEEAAKDAEEARLLAEEAADQAEQKQEIADKKKMEAGFF